MVGSPFTVAGMSTSSSTHHSPNLNAWGGTSTGGTLSTPFTDSISQSRSHYQPGYLLSASQSNQSPQGNQRIDEVPIVQTKAKMNHALLMGSVSDFGKDSMFESSRQRQTLADEDAPPTNSVNDIPREVYVDSNPARMQPRSSPLDKPLLSRRQSHLLSAPQLSQILYIIVFGYPADKYSVTTEYFKSLGEATEPDPNTEIVNCFRIGYKDPGDALRAVRKNGEVLGGTWMIGAKWADPAQAEALLGQPIMRSSFSGAVQLQETGAPSNAMAVDDVHHMSTTPTVGTPIKLAPSTSAFKRSGSGEKPSTPQSQRGWGGSGSGPGTPGFVNAAPTTTQSPGKGVLGQVSDLIFGW